MSDKIVGTNQSFPNEFELWVVWCGVMHIVCFLAWRICVFGFCFHATLDVIREPAVVGQTPCKTAFNILVV